MTRIAFWAAILSVALLGGCATADMPTITQVQANIPTALRTCPALPASPGAKATKRQTAVYILRLYSAAKACRLTNDSTNRLYAKYSAALKRVAKGK